MPKEKHDCYSAERVVRQFNTLHRISAIIQKELRGKESFNDILEEVNEAVDFSSACIFILNRDGERLEEIAKTGKKGDLISFVKFELGSGFSSWVAKYRRPILMPNIKRYRESLDDHIRSFISVPILADGELIGVFNVGNERAGSYDENDLSLIQIIASQISSLIERMRTKCDSSQRHNNTEKVESATVNPLAMLKKTAGRKMETVEDVINRVQKGISKPIAAMANNAKFLRLTLKGSDRKLERNLSELEENINKINDFSLQLGYRDGQ